MTSAPRSLVERSDEGVKVTVGAGASAGGWTMALTPQDRALDLSAVLPPAVESACQTAVTALEFDGLFGTPGRRLSFAFLSVEGERLFSASTTLTSTPTPWRVELGAMGRAARVAFTLEDAEPRDFVRLRALRFGVMMPAVTPALRYFIWTYGLLLANWDQATGLVQDKASVRPGMFDAVQATGGLAAASAVAFQLGVIAKSDAVRIVRTIGSTLRERLPRFHGLWPHWVRVRGGGDLAIVDGTEWSSIDTVIAAVGLLAAEQALDLDTSDTEAFLGAIDWDDLATASGLSMGYAPNHKPLGGRWDSFGGEFWLMALAHAGATGRLPAIAYPTPPTANGSGFIDELAWNFTRMPQMPDAFGNDWVDYAREASRAQRDYFGTMYPNSCLAREALFGLSAAEAPTGDRYLAFGVGGRSSSTLDGFGYYGTPVVAPHYAAMAASILPEDAAQMWSWLYGHGLMSPLTHVDSLMFRDDVGCDERSGVWTQLKGSWDLTLETLGWGRAAARERGETPILWMSTDHNRLLRRGYAVLVPAP